MEPIFSSEDITTQLPVESKKFKSMERTWRRIMNNAYHNPKVNIENSSLVGNHESNGVVGVGYMSG